jgi:hypothetical protein
MASSRVTFSYFTGTSFPSQDSIEKVVDSGEITAVSHKYIYTNLLQILLHSCN